MNKCFHVVLGWPSWYQLCIVMPFIIIIVCMFIFSHVVYVVCNLRDGNKLWNFEYSPRPITVERRNSITMFVQSAVYNSQNVTAASLYYNRPPTILMLVANLDYSFCQFCCTSNHYWSQVLKKKMDFCHHCCHVHCQFL